MVQLTQITTVNASAFVLLLIVKLHMRSQFGRKVLLDARILKIMINLTMFQCLFDTLVFWIDGRDFPFAREMNYIGNIIYYILNGTIAYFWPLFAEYKINGSYKRVKKLATILAVPLGAAAVLSVTAPLNGIVFTISEDNIYSRGDLFVLPTALIFFYVLWGTVNVYINRRKNGKYMIFPAVYFITPIVLGMLVQMFNYGITMSFMGIAIGLTGVYMSTQNESAYIDQLCGVYNRRYYNDYVRSFCASNNKDEKITGVLIDMDNFKPINDNFGHHTGDMALIAFSEILRRHMSKIGFAVRYGGDEFILITKESAEKAEAVVAEIEKETKALNDSGKYQFKLEFSYGMTTVTAGTDAESFLDEMDKRMYEMKKERKGIA